MRLLSILSALCGAVLASVPLVHASSPLPALCSDDVECSRIAAGLLPVPSALSTNVTRGPLYLHRMHTLATPSLGAAGDGLHFRLVTDGAPWSGRAMAQLHVLPKAVTFRHVDTSRSVTYQSPMVMFGGWIPTTFSQTQNDVWASSDSAKTWTLIAGHTIQGDEAAQPDTSFTDTYNAGSASALDPLTGNLYRMGGLLRTPMSNEVWLSTNAIVWREQIALGRDVHTTGFYPAVVANSQGHLIEATGGDTSSFGNDVWMSSDNGRNWRLQTDRAPYSSRYAQAAVNLHNPSALDGKDIMYIIGGQASYDNLNDGQRKEAHTHCSVSLQSFYC